MGPRGRRGHRQDAVCGVRYRAGQFVPGRLHGFEAQQRAARLHGLLGSLHRLDGRARLSAPRRLHHLVPPAARSARPHRHHPGKRARAGNDPFDQSAHLRHLARSHPGGEQARRFRAREPEFARDPRPCAGGDDRAQRHGFRFPRRPRQHARRNAARAPRCRLAHLRMPVRAQERPCRADRLDRNLVGAGRSVFLHRPRHDRAHGAGRPIAPGAEDGGDRAAHRRRRARFQQSAHRHHRHVRAAGGFASGRTQSLLRSCRRSTRRPRAARSSPSACSPSRASSRSRRATPTSTMSWRAPPRSCSERSARTSRSSFRPARACGRRWSIPRRSRT